MANEWAAPPPPKPRRRWPRRLAWCALGGLVLLVALYFFVTSFTFVKMFVLPRVNESIRGTVKLADTSISPFSRVTLRGVRVETGVFEEPLLVAKEIRVRYSLWSILRGNINVEEIWIDSPVLQIVDYDDATSNLSRLPKPPAPGKQPGKQPAPSTQPSKSPQFHLKRLILTNAVVRQIKTLPAGGKQVVELSNLHVAIQDVGNARGGSLKLAAALRLNQGAAADALQARLAGGFDFRLSPDSMPQSLTGNATLEVAGASGQFRDLAGLSATLDCDLAPTELRQLSLGFTRGGRQFGRIAVTGPLDPARMEGDLTVEIAGIDRQALNLAGAMAGIDFGGTTLNSTHHIAITNHAQLVTAVGRLSASQISVTRSNAATQPIDLQLDYHVVLDQAAKAVRIESFTLGGTQNQAQLLRGALTRPMRLSLAGATNVADDSAFIFTVTNLNLADWRPFLGEISGMAGLTLNVSARNAGRGMSIDLATRLDGLSARFGSNSVEQADASARVRGRMENFQRVDLEECRLELAHRRQPALSFTAGGYYDLGALNADIKAGIDIKLASGAAMLRLPETSLAGGRVKLDVHLVQRNLTPERTNNPSLQQDIDGALNLDELTGRYATFQFDRFATTLDFEATLKDQRAELRKLAGSFKPAGQAGGKLDATGSFQLTNQTGAATFAITGLTERTFQPFVASALGETRLAGVAAGMTGSVTYDPKGDSAAKVRILIADLLLSDPKRALPELPLTAELNFDASLRNDRAEIREFAGRLRQGEIPAGGLQVTGSYDLKQQSGKAVLKLTDLNEKALAPLLAPALGDRKLDTVSIACEFNASYNAKGESTMDGGLKIARLLVRDPGGTGEPLEADVQLAAALRGDEASLSKLAVSLMFGSQPGCSLSANGAIDLKKKSANGSLKLVDLNQHALRPFLAPALGDKTLTSVSINADLKGHYEPAGNSAIQGELTVDKLLVQDPASKFPRAPLSAALRLIVGLGSNLVKLDQVQLRLSPTDRAKNELAITGKLDLSRTNAVAGDLFLTAESLDLTPYSELFTGPTTAKAPPVVGTPKAAPRPAAPRPVATAQSEPAAIQLPLDDFTLGLSIGRLYLSELAVRDWQATNRIARGRVALKPFQLVLNGGSVSVAADLDLARPGYSYDVALSADHVPLEPIVNTFAPDQRGKYKGNLIAVAQIKGAGVTGSNLRSNLNGELRFSFTNADLQIASPMMKTFFTPIALLLRMPELLNAPLSWVGGNARLGGGRIGLTRFDLVSASFLADTQGEIPIADVLLDSPLTQWPMHFHVPRAAAERLKLVPRGTPPDSAFVKLPDFIRVNGTLGEPKPELNKAALGGAVLEKFIDNALPKKPGAPNPLDILRLPR